MTYLKSFTDVYLLGVASDFQDYSEEIYPTTRPFSYKDKLMGFDDLFSTASPLDFLTYLSKFKDLYIIALAVREDMDYVKSLDANILVQKNVPKNVA